MPRSLDLGRLKQFEVAQPAAAPPAAVVPSPMPMPMPMPTERWPSREPANDGQISIKAPVEVIERFRRLCKDDRRTYSDMLEILMDAFERKA